MLDLIRRERAVRGDVMLGKTNLPRKVKWEVIDVAEPGQFCVAAYVVGQRERLWWDVGRDGSRAIVSGTSGGGKTQLLATWAIYPTLWNQLLGAGWGETLILDPKATAAYQPAQNMGAVLVKEPEDLLDALADIARDTQARNRLLGEIVKDRVDDSGIEREDGEVSIWHLTPAEWDEYGLWPRAVFVDELSDLMNPNPDDFPPGFWKDGMKAKVARDFTHVARKSRSAGYVIVIGNQRMDVSETAGGLVREQFPSRLVLGEVTEDHYKMMFGDSGARMIPPEGDSLTAGHGWATNMGGKSLARLLVPEINLANYAALKGAGDGLGFDPKPFVRRHAGTDPEDPDDGQPTPGLDDQARKVWAHLAEHPRSSRREVAEETGVPLGTLEKQLLNQKAGRKRHTRMFVEVERGGPGGRPSLFSAVPDAPDPTPSPVGPPVGGGHREGVWGWQVGAGVGEEAWWRAAAQGGRALATGWLARMILRAWGLRHLWGHLEAGSRRRDPKVIRQAHAEGNGRCRWCGRAGQLQVDHRRMLSAGGADVVENTQLLCMRPGKPSCHAAKTAGERTARAIRRRTATVDDSAGSALRKNVAPLLEVVHVDQVVFGALLLLGLLGGLGIVGGGWKWPALAALVYVATTLVPWAFKIWRNRGRTNPDHRATKRIDPAADEDRRKETFWALREKRKWWSRYRIKRHARATVRAKSRAAIATATGRYLAGFLAPKIVPLLPTVIAAVFGVLF
jgi:hypothetical protein